MEKGIQPRAKMPMQFVLQVTNSRGFQDLLAAVEKINSSLNKKEKTKGYNYFYQDEIEALGLGPKGRAYLLLLVRMNHLVVETADGQISY
ncbi:hypothetical protein GOBAR_AA12412 [Gossypium barbadense]|uniref:Uncharacterized protein n=1 Tax=Gossypium barbadense TaxID=3634 RepID=A0A2P5XY15_GOSBA|nr:hypothetical protein GOBAR_AA12412 [Gossypium barbadense]